VDVYALLIFRGAGGHVNTDYISNRSKDVICDAGILVQRAEEEEGVWRRVGYFEQHYWVSDGSVLFAGEEKMKKQVITLV